MRQVRFGVVGVGGMGGHHCRSITQARDRRFRLAAVADIDPAIAQRVGEAHGVPWFVGDEAMYDSGLVDAVIVAVPHYWHPAITVRAARRGLHVLCEKPLASTVGPARTMVAECRRHRVALGAMLQMRSRGIMQAMKRIVDAGELGEIFRVSMVCSHWYRTQRYYDSGSWRGTWDGEGGGVLLNQAPHSLDLFQWIGGMPRRVIAVLDTRLHRIEVENTANVICDYGSGRNGYLYATTAEAPGAEQFVVAGDRGTLVAEGGTLRRATLNEPISRHLMTCRQRMAPMTATWRPVTWRASKTDGQHINIIRNFARHVTDGAPLIAPGHEAIHELELSNAVYLSGFGGRPVELPVDAAAVERLIARLERQRSTGRGGGHRRRAARALRRAIAAGGPQRRKRK